MLLIDFDELMEMYSDFYNEFAVHDLRYLKKECLPTVEAIPIEFIKKYYKGITMPFTDTRIQFEELIRKWKAENETN